MDPTAEARQREGSVSTVLAALDRGDWPGPRAATVTLLGHLLAVASKWEAIAEELAA